MNTRQNCSFLSVQFIVDIINSILSIQRFCHWKVVVLCGGHKQYFFSKAYSNIRTRTDKKRTLLFHIKNKEVPYIVPSKHVSHRYLT